MHWMVWTAASSGRGKRSRAVDLRAPAEAGSRLDIELPTAVATPSDPRRELLVVTAGDRSTTLFHAEDKDVDYPSPAFDVEVTPGGDMHTVRVTARTLLRDLTALRQRCRLGGAAVGARQEALPIATDTGGSTPGCSAASRPLL